MSLVLEGRDLRFAEIASFLEDEHREIHLSEEMLLRLDHGTHQFAELALTRTIYGLNTGFGPMAYCRIPPDQWSALQVNLIRSHALGLGNPLPLSCVRAVLLARLATLARGYSAVDRTPVRMIATMLSRDCLPVIPEHGGVGASGDLVQLAHLGLCLIGDGDAWFGGEQIPAAKALSLVGLSPLRPQLREGLAIMNGTSAMTGIAVEAVMHAGRLVDWCLALSSLIQEVVGNSTECFSEELSALKQHRGQAEVALHMRQLLAGSKALRQSHDDSTLDRPVQEPYSLRCVPQIVGPVLETLRQSQATVLAELNSVSDNPAFDPDTGRIYHGGNFHGEYIAASMDHLKIAITKLSMLSERQLNYLLNDRINGLLPPFLLVGKPGLHLGLQGAQFVATSTTAENQTLAYPMSLHTIPCNGDNQDVVSMGANAALLARRIILNAFDVVSILSMAVVLAVDILGLSSKLAPGSQVVWAQLRDAAPTVGTTPPDHRMLQALREYIQLHAPAVCGLSLNEPRKMGLLESVADGAVGLP